MATIDTDKIARRAIQLQDTTERKFKARLRRGLKAAYLNAAEGLAIGQNGIDAAVEREVEDTLRDLYRDATRRMARDLVNQFKSEFEWLETKAGEEDFYERLYEEFVRQYGANNVQAITATTRRQIREVIERGLKEGLSLPEIQKELQKRAPVLSALRAEVISRTETHSAAMYASLQSAKRSSRPLVKEWISVEDARTRDFGSGDGEIDMYNHRDMNEVQVPLDQPFKVPDKNGGFDELMFPGDPNGQPGNIIRCRCAQVYKMAEDQEEEEAAPPSRKPEGPDRAALFAAIKKEQPTFWRNWDTAFENSDELIVSAIALSPDLGKMKRGKGAYANFAGQISMGKHKKGTADYKRVFRHEYGHVLDDRMSKLMEDDPKRKIFKSFDAIDDMIEDFKEIDAARTGYFSGPGEGSILIDKVFEANKEAHQALRVELRKKARQNGTKGKPREILRDNIPDIDPDELVGLWGVTTDDIQELDAYEIVAAWQRRDSYKLSTELPIRFETRVDHGGPLAGIQDTIEASSGGVYRAQFGHGKSYYRSGQGYLKAQNPTKVRIDPDKERFYNGYSTAQAFANWTEAYASGNIAQRELYRRLWPRTFDKFEAMVREYVELAGGGTI